MSGDSLASSERSLYICIYISYYIHIIYYIYIYIYIYIYVYIYKHTYIHITLTSSHLIPLAGVQRAADGLLSGQQWSGTQITCFTGTQVQILTQKALLQMWECSASGPRSMTALVKEQIGAVEEDRKMLITDGASIA
jgi:hypothetical protein